MTFVHVVPSEWGAWVDVRASFASLARRHPWVQVISLEEFRVRAAGGELWDDPDVLFVNWLLDDPGPRERRRCLVAGVYTEAMDEDESKLLPAHLDLWHRVKTVAGNFDGIFAHTPWMASMVGRMGIQAYVMPLGWDAEAMGAPRWHAPKHERLVFHGTNTPRRALILPIFERLLGNYLVNISGQFGRGLLGRLDTAAAALYIANSPVRSFSTWRLWQAASTSAAVLAEPGDTWPFEAGKHFLALPPITLDNLEAVARDIARLADEHNLLLRTAETAHEVARRYTVDRIEEEFLVPAALAMRAARA